jgi:hypothetical protein
MIEIIVIMITSIKYRPPYLLLHQRSQLSQCDQQQQHHHQCHHVDCRRRIAIMIVDPHHHCLPYLGNLNHHHTLDRRLWIRMMIVIVTITGATEVTEERNVPRGSFFFFFFLCFHPSKYAKTYIMVIVKRHTNKQTNKQKV